MRVLVGSLALLLATACAPKHHVPNPSPFDEDDPEAGGWSKDGNEPDDGEIEERPLPDGVSIATLPDDAPTVRQRLTVDRAALMAFVRRGPRALLSAVKVEAHTEGDRLLGWRVGADMGAIDLREGDLIRAVNGSRLERPEHLQAMWEKLPDTERVIVEGTRHGRPFELWFEVAATADDAP